MDAEAIVERVRARRAVRAGMNVYRAEEACGIARHRTTGCISYGLANKALGAVTDELGRADTLMVRDLCIEAMFDGYELAGAITGVEAKNQGKAFARGNDTSRFETKVTRSGAALLDGALAAPARALIDERLAGLPDALRSVAERAFANAMASGLLLHAHEHERNEPVFASLAPKAEKRKTKDTTPAKTAPPSPELLGLVLAAPDDDEPRLVYADWLSEQGDPRGEFIQIQCMLGRALLGAGAKYASREGRKLPYESRQELEAREKELVKKHEAEWLAPIRRYIRQWQLRRGFVDHVIADAGAFLDGLDALKQVPLTSAKLTGFKASHAAKLAAATKHPTLRQLDLSRNRIDARTAHALKSELLEGVRDLSLWGNPLGDAGLAELAQARMPALRALSLSKVDATAKGVLALAKAPFFASLESLDLSFNRELGVDAVPAFDAATSLRRLDVDLTAMDEATIEALKTRFPRKRWDD